MPATVFEQVAALIEEHYFDERFLERRWPELRAQGARRYELAASREERERAVRDLIDSVGVSHLVLITPAVSAEIETKTADPRRLRPGLRAIGGTIFARIRSFKVQTTRMADLAELASMLSQADSLVLDLRLNDGGSGGLVCELASMFLPPDTPVLRIRDRLGRSRERPFVVGNYPEEENRDHLLEVETILREHHVEHRTTAEPVGRFDGEVTVLVGPRCYSCGEVFVQAMKEHSRARVVGRPSAGFVVAAREFPLENGYRLLLPFADMESGKGHRLEGSGVRPHIEADLPDGDEAEVLARLS